MYNYSTFGNYVLLRVLDESHGNNSCCFTFLSVSVRSLLLSYAWPTLYMNFQTINDLKDALEALMLIPIKGFRWSVINYRITRW